MKRTLIMKAEQKTSAKSIVVNGCIQLNLSIRLTMKKTIPLKVTKESAIKRGLVQFQYTQ